MKLSNYTIYYVFYSEVENDPAPKTRTDNPMFKRVGAKKTGHNLVSCSPMDDSGKNNYYYNWLDEAQTAYNQFYSNYNFQLSALNSITKGKSTSYTTNLRITDKNGKFDTKPIMDSKLANSITSISSLIKSVQDFFSKPTQPAPKVSENTFTMNASFQQKRSGDWLQVLLCLIVLQRRYKNSNTGEADIQKLFEEIYFVTHDRIAMAFALLLGINVIFTHGESQQAISFKIQNPQQKTVHCIRKVSLLGPSSGFGSAYLAFGVQVTLVANYYFDDIRIVINLLECIHVYILYLFEARRAID
jgi:hypothetical protein